MDEHVILVDAGDRVIGTAEKMEAHRCGALHRAISIFVFDAHDRLLLQRRARSKYHSGGLWSNTCCSHPRPEEDVLAAGHRRLLEEMGFACELSEAFSFRYRVEFPDGLIENEYDHVLFGRHDGIPVPHPDEADDWKWMAMDELGADVRLRPSSYSFWFAACFDRVAACLVSGEARRGPFVAPSSREPRSAQMTEPSY